MEQVESIEINNGYTFEEQFKQLYELSDDPRRKEFLDDLFQFMANRNQPVNRIPIMAKQVLDLYELYNLVVARGGLVEVINKKIWREITKGLNLPSSITSAAFTLRTQYMKYLYPYECAKNNFSHQEELQQAIDGNRRESRRAGSAGLAGAYGAYLGQAANAGALTADGRFSASPSPNNHLLASHNLLSAAAAQQNHHNQQRIYQDSIESDHDADEGSIDLSHSPKRNSPNLLDHHEQQQHLVDGHNTSVSRQQQAAAEHHQQLAAAAAAAALRQQLGAAVNFPGMQNLFCHLANQVPQANQLMGGLQAPQQQAQATNLSQTATINGGNGTRDSSELNMKQQQEQFLAALMAAATGQQQPPQIRTPQTGSGAQTTTTNNNIINNNNNNNIPINNNSNSDQQQAAARAVLSGLSTNAMILSASNVPDAMAVATAAQAIGVKGAFIILLL